MRERNPLSIRKDDESWKRYYREYFRNNESQRIKNIARCSYNSGLRRAKLYNRPYATDEGEIKLMKQLYLKVAETNAILGQRQFSVDHIKELATDCDSSHTYENLAILPLKDNVMKSHRERNKLIRPKQIKNKETR